MIIDNPTIINMLNVTKLFLNNSMRLSYRSIYTTNIRFKTEDKKQMLASMPVKDEGTVGEKVIDIDTLVSDKSFQRFPNINTHKQLFNGIPFDEVPICNVKVRKIT